MTLLSYTGYECNVSGFYPNLDPMDITSNERHSKINVKSSAKRRKIGLESAT